MDDEKLGNGLIEATNLPFTSYRTWTLLGPAKYVQSLVWNVHQETHSQTVPMVLPW